MTVGSTYTTMTVREVFDRIGEIQILSRVFPGITSLPCLISSPLRTDNKPSFSLYVNKNSHISFHDFATGDHGSLLDLLCKYWNCDYRTCITNICSNFKELQSAQKTGIPARKISVSKKGDTKIDVKVRDWKEHDRNYWQSYGCDIRLLKYAEVYPVSHTIITKLGKTYTIAAPKYCYVFIERKEGKITKKIYSPFAKEHKWTTDNDKSVIGLWEKVPDKGDRLCICSSLKDAVCLWTNSKIPCVYIQGEAFDMSDTAINVLKQRFDRIYICLDNDEAGLKDAVKLCQRTGFENVVIPQFEKGKDLSDYYKAYGSEMFKKNVVQLFK